MLRREVLILGLVAAAVLAVLVAASVFSLHLLHRETAKVVSHNLPSLVVAGGGLTRIQDTWAQTQRLLNTPSFDTRASLINQIESRSAAEFWLSYEKLMDRKPDRQGFERMLQARENFLRIRREFFTTVQSGNSNAAAELLADRLSPAYYQYRNASEALFTSDAEMAGQRARQITSSITKVGVLMGILNCLLFSLGVLFGLAGALRGLDILNLARPVYAHDQS